MWNVTSDLDYIFASITNFKYCNFLSTDSRLYSLNMVVERYVYHNFSWKLFTFTINDITQFRYSRILIIDLISRQEHIVIVLFFLSKCVSYEQKRLYLYQIILWSWPLTFLSRQCLFRPSAISLESDQTTSMYFIA